MSNGKEFAKNIHCYPFIQVVIIQTNVLRGVCMLIDIKILCIDLKSFFAFVECVDRGFNAFKTPLVVASIKQCKEAISLAVTPYLKSL